MAAAASALRNLAPKAALVLASIAVSLGIIEIGLRVAGFEPRHDAVNVGFELLGRSGCRDGLGQPRGDVEIRRARQRADEFRGGRAAQ